ncbi:hypothetical protein KR200_002774 [Drosophila serrata]|nr:hypothetical protein KR200_002774 [Drosophila serrata]
MLLGKLLWITGILAILYGAGTQAHPVFSAEKHGSRIAISLIEAKKPMGHIEEGFCVQPKAEHYKKIKVNDLLNCATEKKSWTMSHLKGLKAIEGMILRKDLPALMSLKRSIQRRIPRKTYHKYHRN